MEQLDWVCLWLGRMVLSLPVLAFLFWLWLCLYVRILRTKVGLRLAVRERIVARLAQRFTLETVFSPVVTDVMAQVEASQARQKGSSDESGHEH